MATDYSRYQYIKIEKDRGLITLTLNRPDSLNSIVPQMHHELETIWVDVSEDPEVNAVLLTGAPVLVIDFNPVFGLNGGHKSSSDSSCGDCVEGPLSSLEG